MWNRPKFGNKHGGRPYKEGGAFVDLNVRILPITKAWLKENGGSGRLRELIDKAMSKEC